MAPIISKMTNCQMLYPRNKRSCVGDVLVCLCLRVHCGPLLVTEHRLGGWTAPAHWAAPTSAAGKAQWRLHGERGEEENSYKDRKEANMDARGVWPLNML